MQTSLLRSGFFVLRTVLRIQHSDRETYVVTTPCPKISVTKIDYVGMT
jgi:hypothetical protein